MARTLPVVPLRNDAAPISRAELALAQSRRYDRVRRATPITGAAYRRQIEGE
jgi:hypothetical protein